VQRNPNRVSKKFSFYLRRMTFVISIKNSKFVCKVEWNCFKKMEEAMRMEEVMNAYTILVRKSEKKISPWETYA